MLLRGLGEQAPATLPAPYADWPGPPDPYAIADLATDARPPEYASNYAMLASLHSGLERPISVCTCEVPEWLQATMNLLSLERITVEEALQDYAALPPA